MSEQKDSLTHVKIVSFFKENLPIEWEVKPRVIFGKLTIIVEFEIESILTRGKYRLAKIVFDEKRSCLLVHLSNTQFAGLMFKITTCLKNNPPYPVYYN